jgi:hypothetical protein
MNALGRILFLLVLACVGTSLQAQDAQKAAAEAKEGAEDARKAAKQAEASAQDAKKSAEKADLVAAKSGDDFSNDSITVETNTVGFNSERDKSKKNLIAMAGTRLRVIREKDGVLYVSVQEIPCKLDASGKVTTKLNSTIDLVTFGLAAEFRCHNASSLGEHVVPGEAYTIPKTEIVRFGYVRSGVVYGLLLVPYKYHRHDKSFTSSVTVGPYFGTRVGYLGLDSSLVISVGLTSLNVANANGQTSTQQGYTIAAGMIWSITKNKSPLQFGLLVGKDWAGSNASPRYVHEGKTWIAAQIGFNFSD